MVCCCALIPGTASFPVNPIALLHGVMVWSRWISGGLLVVALGWVGLNERTRVQGAHDLRVLVEAEGALARVRGHIVSSPKVVRVGFAERRQFLVETEAVQLNSIEHWQPAVGKVWVAVTNRLETGWHTGANVELDGVLRRPSSAAYPGGFDRRHQLARRGVYHELRTDDLSSFKLLSQSRPLPWGARFREWGRECLARGLPKDEAVELLWAMSLGWRTGLTAEVAGPFMQSGTLHLFAISGLHVALVAGILVVLLRVLRLGRQGAALVAIPLLWFYAGATGWQPSAVRATVMMTVLLGGWVFRRPVNVLNSLGLAAFLILLNDPQQLFRVSFQLSFAVVFSLALVVPPVGAWLNAKVQPDAYLPQPLWPWWRRWILWPSQWIAGALAVSFGAWLASLPLVAHHFHLFNPVALLANVPVVFCGMAALASCLGSLLFGVWLEPVSVCFNHTAWFFMHAMMTLSREAAELPGAWQYVRAPERWMMAGWYALLFGIGSGWFLKSTVRRWALAGGIVFIGMLGYAWFEDRRTVRMTFLPGGPVTHVEQGGMLVDCGDERMAEFVIPRHLRVRGVDQLEGCVITHAVGHHAGGIGGLLEQQPLNWLKACSARSTSRVQKELDALLDAVESNGLLSANDWVNGWQVLHPPPGKDFRRSSNDALVLRGEFHGVRVLLLGDLGHDGRQSMARQVNDLQADILVVSKPDRSLPVGVSFLKLVKPKVIVVQDCDFPVTKRASREWLNELGREGAVVMSLRQFGGVRLNITPNGWRVEGFDGLLYSR